jgi:N,N-dimethylformamidase
VVSNNETSVRSDVNHRSMAVAGYPVPWSQTVGGDIGFHLSLSAPASAVRIVSLDGAPCLGAWDLQTTGDACGVQQLVAGSFLRADGKELSQLGTCNGISVEVFLTRPQTATLVRLADIRLTCEGHRLCVTHAGRDLFGPVPLPLHTWVALELAQADGRTTLSIRGGDRLAPVQIDLQSDHAQPWATGDFVLGSGGSDEISADARFARPMLRSGSKTVAWHFPAVMPDDMRVRSKGDTQVAMTAVNLPTFSVRSCRWDGSTFDPRLAGDHYDAIHTHSDDMGAADWPQTCRVIIPVDAIPGVYALEVTTPDRHERIPFFVRNRQAHGKAVVLLPTATYLAYLNEALPPEHFPWAADDRGHRFARDNGLLSLYDFHADHSGVCITSTRKPMATLRDDYVYPLCGCPHLLPVDLRLLRFLRDQGVAFDLLTDHDLHRGGRAALAGYDVVITGSHPEYASVQMEGALADFLVDGGHLAYLGGNGFAGTVAFRNDLMELRRGPAEAGRTWDGPISEQSLSLTGEPGGYLRHRAKGEFALLGGAISLMGFGLARPFLRTPDSHDPTVAWLFAGVEQAEFGNDGTVLGGAAGYEVDATDPHLGTSPDTVIVAFADGFPNDFSADAGRWHPRGEAEARNRRVAEMTLRTLPAGGMIFSASSVAWCGALPDPGKMNDVGRITMNFLARALMPLAAQVPDHNGARHRQGKIEG